MTRKQKKHYNKLIREANIKRKRLLQAKGTHMTVPKDLSGPERWALVEQITKTNQTKDTRTLKQLVAEHRADMANTYTDNQGKTIQKYKAPNTETKIQRKLRNNMRFRSGRTPHQINPYTMSDRT